MLAPAGERQSINSTYVLDPYGFDVDTSAQRVHDHDNRSIELPIILEGEKKSTSKMRLHIGIVLFCFVVARAVRLLTSEKHDVQ